MIIDFAHKQILIRVPKSASTSVEMTIRNNTDFTKDGSLVTAMEYTGVDGINHDLLPDPHANVAQILAESLIEKKDIPLYNIYGTIRNPLDRFFSWIAHVEVYGYSRDSSFLSNLTNEQKSEIIEKYVDIAKQKLDKENNILGAMGLQLQSHWLCFNGQPINKLYKFENAQYLVNEFLANRGAGPATLEHHKGEWRPQGFDKTLLSQEQVNTLTNLYKSDIELYNKAM